jgi:dihydroorotase
VLTELEALYQAGAVTFTDDGRSVMDPLLLHAAFRKAAELDVPISSHCEDHHLVPISRYWTRRKNGL